MNDQLLIALILFAVTIVMADLTMINPTTNICNDDYCNVDYYKKFKSDPKFST